jgi:hypothetical protein
MIILQNAVATSELSLTSSSSAIATALQTAAWTLPSTTRECSYFSAAVTTVSTTEIVIYVTFLVDNSEPLTLLSVFDSTLTGEYSYFN